MSVGGEACPYGAFVCPYCGEDVDRDTRTCVECKENHGQECGEAKEMTCRQCYEDEDSKAGA